ncbi:response regulator transcription factor [Hymenobacter gummosus]|uniref:Response regulator transcription factor n=1 Tax=Hymenobacter gummosus TaxID=1776032 RepID=A0A3S0JCS1_9BACT|nr:response regulator transcription factor [Hymenobacter gummosus]RTQ48104.1 response regulator transcription factor [Hymenobacter gummosus]
MPSILLIEDEPALGMIVKDSLEVRGFEVRYAADGQQGLELFRQQRPDIVVADVMMPRLDGFSLAEIIRRESPQVPIIFLTARSQPADVVRGFELGAADYLKKPFSMDELIVRIRARLGQSAVPAGPAGLLRLGHYQFDHPKQRLHWPGREEQPLTHREAELLKRLYERRNQVLERAAVLQELWGDDNFFNGRSLDVFITRLRRYLKDDPQVQIVNVRGIGYKLLL